MDAVMTLLLPLKRLNQTAPLAVAAPLLPRYHQSLTAPTAVATILLQLRKHLDQAAQMDAAKRLMPRLRLMCPSRAAVIKNRQQKKM
jgi:hypothetical protein